MTVGPAGTAAGGPPPAAPGAWGFLALGILHVLTGFDHLAFLLALLVVCRRAAAVIPLVTAFTAAHSVTLALAGLDWVRVSGRIVEPLIALSIVFVGVSNLVHARRGRAGGDRPPARLATAAGFGLIHGLGFASALRASGLGANGAPIAVPLLSFNVGVEVGQLAFAAAVLPLVWRLRRWPPFDRRGIAVVSGAVATLGLLWLLQRLST